MLPQKEKNIYPKSEENLKALISYYFDRYDIDQEGAVESMLEKTSVSLNQVEYIIRNLAEAYIPVFKKHFPGGITLKVIFSYYGIGACNKDKFRGSSKAELILSEYLDYLERN